MLAHSVSGTRECSYVVRWNPGQFKRSTSKIVINLATGNLQIRRQFLPLCALVQVVSASVASDFK